MNDSPSHLSAICGILGVDIVAFSTLHIDDQIKAVSELLRWIRSSLDFSDIQKGDYHWSPAGDGGFLTFKTTKASENAIDVAFVILERSQTPTWIPRNGRPFEMKFGLHAGNIQEGEELGGGTNIWGDGINMAARILSVCANSQVMVSVQYYDTYIERRQNHSFSFDMPFRRTVKHGVHVTMRNARKGSFGLTESDELARRWSPIGKIWKTAIDNYVFLINDTLSCANTIAALAATKFLMELSSDYRDVDSIIGDVFKSIGDSSDQPDANQLRHPIFNAMPPPLLRQLVQEATPITIGKDEVLCEEGDIAKSCYFLVYGALLVEGSNIATPVPISQGQIIGDFSLWIHNSRRTATIRAVDDSLLLEVPHELFTQLCDQNQEMASSIYANIRGKILENVTNSPRLFPSLDPRDTAKLKNYPTVVEKHSIGKRLDLKENTFIVFNGRLRIRPPILQGDDFEISADGHFSPDTVVGIRTYHGSNANDKKNGENDFDSVDGDEADVIEEVVAVKIPHDTILIIQEHSKPIQDAWDSIWGMRYGRLARISLQSVNRP